VVAALERCTSRESNVGMVNAELAAAFDEVADLMELLGEDRFRIGSYRRAARVLGEFHEDIAVVCKEKRLTDIPGVGKSMAEKICEYLDTGKIQRLEELKAKLPRELVTLLQIPNMGPKKVTLVHQQLGVKNLEDLKRVIASGELAKLKGLGEQSVKKIADGIAFLESSSERVPLGVAAPLAETLAVQVRQISGVKQVAIAGSLRRGVETIGDIDLLCEAENGPEVIKAFTSLPAVKSVLAAGDTKGSITVWLPGGKAMQVDLRVVPEASFGAAHQYFTGSKAHNIRLREIAIKKGWKLNEWGLFEGEKQLAGRTEEAIYKELHVPMVPPELREDRGECDPHFECPELVTLQDMRGDLHMHTTASDGRCSIDEMAEACKAQGYEYLAICDHSRSSVIANGLSIERMEQHIAAIRAADKRVKGIAILAGCECDILPEGKLDYPDSLLRECDLVVASIHSAQTGGKRTATERTLAAIENPYVTIIGHPTGRLINRRKPMDIDMAQVVAAAARNHTVLEINASWQRLDLKDVHVRQALEAGVLLAIDTDAHSVEQLDQLKFGVTIARRAGATPKDMLNTRNLKALTAAIAKKRGKTHT
jgi:DNA polymerase (family 10)